MSVHLIFSLSNFYAMKINLFHWLICAAITLFAVLPVSAQKTAAKPEKMPEYPGGFEALSKYMTANIQYPEAAKKEKAEGDIIVKFTVEADGSLSSISTVNEGVAPRSDFALEAVRVVKGMPKWTSAQDKGKAVKCEMALPVKFKLGTP
jgi:TonB family protein